MGLLKSPSKVLSLKELHMAKRILKGRKAAPCQKELGAMLTAMDREKGDGAKASIKLLQTALEHCLNQAVSDRV
jgi:hypothetical protein